MDKCPLPLVLLRPPALALRNQTGTRYPRRADIREWLPPYAPVAAVFAFPPGTDVTASGARRFKSKGMGGLIRALRLFEAGLRIADWTSATVFDSSPGEHRLNIFTKADVPFDRHEYGGYQSTG